MVWMLVKLLHSCLVKHCLYGILKTLGIIGPKLIQIKFAPIIAVPTTAGTGSETGRASAIINKETGAKKLFFTQKCYLRLLF